MVRQLRPLFSQQQTRQSATRLFHKRERRKSLFDPTFELFETHRFNETQNPISADRFPTDAFLSPVTFHTEIAQTGASPTGVVFSFGNATRGLAMWLQGQDVGIAAGGPANNGMAAVIPSVLRGVGQTRVRLTMIAHPGYGAIALYVDDDLSVYSTSSTNSFTDGWALQAAGAVADVSASPPSRIPAARRVALSGAALVKDVRAFEAQYPRQLSIYFGTSGTVGPLGPVTPPAGTGGSFDGSFDGSFEGGTP